MIVQIQLFARARDLVGSASVTLDLPGPCTVGELRGCLIQGFPALETLARRSAIALNEEFANDSELIDEHSKLALLPPVSGGSPVGRPVPA
jgi:molybdopterin converting factor subunit 1